MKPVVTTVTLVTEDGVPIEAVHLPGPRDLAIVIAHGFTQSWQGHMVWDIVRRFNLTAGVVTFDFRGHGRSGGLSTLGDKEINDLDVAVHYAREPKELWLIPGFGHAERATDDELVDRIVAWVTEAVTRPAAAAGHEPTATSQ